MATATTPTAQESAIKSVRSARFNNFHSGELRHASRCRRQYARFAHGERRWLHRPRRSRQSALQSADPLRQKLQFFWQHNNNVKETFTSTLAADIDPGEWHEYRVTRNATTGEVIFYVDGNQLGDTLLFDPNSKLPTGGRKETVYRDQLQPGRRREVRWQPSTGGWMARELEQVATSPLLRPILPCGLIRRRGMATAPWTRRLDAVRSGQLFNMVGLTAAQAFALGDLNGDFTNNHADLCSSRMRSRQQTAKAPSLPCWPKCRSLQRFCWVSLPFFPNRRGETGQDGSFDGSIYQIYS